MKPSQSVLVRIRGLDYHCRIWGSPRAPILALCHRLPVARQLALEWGVVSRYFAARDDVDAMIEDALRFTRDVAALPAGAPVVIAYGNSTAEAGSTSLIVLRHLPVPDAG